MFILKSLWKDILIAFLISISAIYMLTHPSNCRWEEVC